MILMAMIAILYHNLIKSAVKMLLYHSVYQYIHLISYNHLI